MTTQRTYKPKTEETKAIAENTTQSQETPATQAPATDSTATQVAAAFTSHATSDTVERRTGKGSLNSL